MQAKDSSLLPARNSFSYQGRSFSVFLEKSLPLISQTHHCVPSKASLISCMRSPMHPVGWTPRYFSLRLCSGKKISLKNSCFFSSQYGSFAIKFAMENTEFKNFISPPFSHFPFPKKKKTYVSTGLFYFLALFPIRNQHNLYAQANGTRRFPLYWLAMLSRI